MTTDEIIEEMFSLTPEQHKANCLLFLMKNPDPVVEWVVEDCIVELEGLRE